MRPIVTIFFLFISCCANAQHSGARPKIGLTLSGGGAKGLAHIGILKAIDSAGLKIDYITGTSMGGIIGALYAVGYSGKQIEELQKGIDWDVLLSNQIPLQALSMEEKDEYSRYAAELPFINGKIRLPNGVIRGQELHLKFAELFFHVYNIRDFNQLPIPYKCIATDLETGNLVVLDTGHIVTALRSTMAIPSVFTAVSRDGKKLVDGGLVRNFPVKNVKEMGAEIVIGSNVSGGLSKIDKIKTPIDVLLQMAFFKEAGDFKEELPLTNVYIYQPLDRYNSSSFGSSKEILELGIKTGRAYYPVFKKLADSLNAIEATAPRPVFIPSEQKAFITEYEIKGLNKTTPNFFAHLMNFNDHQYYSAAQISKSIRKAYGSRYYASINYVLEPVSKDTARIIFTVEENPGTYVKAGLFYTRFRGINVNVNLTTRDFIIPNSRTVVAASLGESIQLQAEHLQYLGRIKNIALMPGFTLDNLSINSYNDFKIDGSYKMTFYKGYLHFQTSGSNKLALGIGTAYEGVHFRPNIKSTREAKGRLEALKSYLYLKYNNVNQIFYPTRGLKFTTELGQVYNQKSHLTYFENGVPAGPLNFDNYTRFTFDGSLFVPLKPKLVLFSELQAGINFTNQPNVLNNFQVGGINGQFRNQVRFAGLAEATVNSSSVAALQLGMRYNIFNNTYIIGRLNGLVKDFATVNNSTSKGNALSGYALTFAYRTPIGPLELSAMFSDQSRKVQSYVLFGIPF